ncbi:hypothetical protein BT93_L4351 [Corymbia citriodora subsp. variegata]|uniref:RING-type domain-containing protein n=1 Tax=Corymbia citriodora subsp. variegata TaxID=360336 RepID=A0A8T0CUB5_CORYI|nr:hypothetical protein BT93_L4351 [Corymbia citriodora subsp. variegata]
MLAEIRGKVQCPICLGIIRKTSAVMECLHRFCQECIAEYMLLRSNTCPACHAHCGRNSLRADPGYDALIGAFYPNVGNSKELAFHEGKMTWQNQFQTKAQGRNRITAKASTAVFVKRSPDPEVLGALADINDAHPVFVAEDLTHDSSEKATNPDTDHVALLHKTFVPAPTPSAEHDLNASLPSIGVNVGMSELRLEEEAAVISTTIGHAVVETQEESEMVKWMKEVQANLEEFKGKVKALKEELKEEVKALNKELNAEVKALKDGMTTLKEGYENYLIRLEANLNPSFFPNTPSSSK